MALPLALPTALLATGCEAYEGVPLATIAGAQEGVLTDPKASFTVIFDKPVQPETARLAVARLVVDAEGLLGDEDASDDTDLNPLFALDGTSEEQPLGGTYEWNETNTRLVIQPDLTFPIGEKLVLLLEPGLSDTSGHAYTTRERVPFSYEVKLNCAPSPIFKSGAYFFLADVTEPIAVQVQLLARLDVNPETGELTGEFVNADRNRDASRCTPFGLSCNEKEEACRTIPAPACVVPSEKASSVDEFPDYLPNYEPPVGFAFTVSGCVDGQSTDKTLFINIPVDVIVQSPPVSLKQTVMTASFAEDAEGILRGTGFIAAEHVQLGNIDSGKAEGVIHSRFIPEDQVPKGLK